MVLLLLLSPSLYAQVEEFAVEAGLPLFGEQPWVFGNTVVWRRNGSGARRPMIQSKDISRIDNPVLDVVPYPQGTVGVLLAEGILFRGVMTGRDDGSPIFARKTENLAEGTKADIVVTDLLGGQTVAATRDYVFIRFSHQGKDPHKNSYFAKEMAHLGDPSTEALKLVVRYRTEKSIDRTESASGKYFVWQDRDPDVPDDSWKLYAREMADLFIPGSERFVVDTKVSRKFVLGTEGVRLDLSGGLLIFEGARENERDGRREIFFLDLDSPSEPFSLASTVDPSVYLVWPAISAEYAVWTEVTHVTTRVPYARRLVDGKPAGENFQISSGDSGGSWLAIDRNIVVWNGATSLDGGEVVHAAIMAAELPLPGAEDVGDVDLNGRIDITDPIVILSYLFFGGGQPRRRLADADLSQTIGIEDAISLFKYLFLGGPRPGQG